MIDNSKELDSLADKAIKGGDLTDREIEFIVNFDDIGTLCQSANRIKNEFFSNKVEFCSIINAKSGRCPENCKFCAQSAHYKTDIKEYDFVELEVIENQVKMIKPRGVKRFSVVASGKSPTKRELSKIEEAIKIVRKHGLLCDISVGILDKETIERFKNAGLNGLHHNLETAESFFRNICTTHSYSEDIETVKNAVASGLYVCSGGIFGVGENWNHRIELALTLRSLNVQSVPINFLVPIKGTPLENIPVLSEDEALRIVALYRFLLPDKQIRICGGRNKVFSNKTKTKLLLCGASGIMVGNYLTTSGFDIDSDIEDIERLDLKLS